MPKPRRKLPKGIQVRKNGTLQIAYKNEFGKIERENTGQSDVKAAELMLAQARTDVAMKKRFTALSFESVKFIDLFNDWWTNHGSRTRSKFQYRTPRVIARFGKSKAREVNPDAVRDFLARLSEKVRSLARERPVNIGWSAMYWLDERRCLTFNRLLWSAEASWHCCCYIWRHSRFDRSRRRQSGNPRGMARWLRSFVQQGRRADGCTAVFFHLLIEQHASGMKPLFDTPSEALRRRGTA